MDLPTIWKKPIVKQCFACFGPTLSTVGLAHVLTFTSVFLPQLKESKFIDLDDERESWIASICGLSHIIGIVVVPSIMGKFGRKTASIICNGILTLTWVSLALASSYHSILSVRFFQGLTTGMNSILNPVIIGEYASPKYRGAFLTTIAVSLTIGLLVVHGLGMFFNWKHLSLIFASSALLNCIIVIFSPETPSFLASCVRFEECRKSFHWLRHPDEELELEKLIKANMKRSFVKDNSTFLEKLKRKYTNFLVMLKKKEFYKPVILMFHLHIINEWSAANILDAYTVNVYTLVIGSAENAFLIMISTDILRLITNFIAVIVIRKVKRRTMLLGTILLTIATLLLTAAHVYAKSHGISTFDNPIVGILLIHLHVVTIAVGTVPLPNIISGEIFSLQYRGISSMITSLFFCVNMIINMKTSLYLFATIGLHGAYMIYAGLVSYGLLISLIMLPETKDKTLQDIEEEFRGERKTKDSEPFILHQGHVIDQINDVKV